MSNYYTFGPFAIPRKAGAKGKKVLDDSTAAINRFWKDVGRTVQGLPTARGCYVFGMRAGKGIKPWYVGQSTTGLRDECFQPTKVNYYHDVINNTNAGTPVLILIARHTKGHKLSSSLPEKEANFVEQYLIGLALRKNPELKNIKHTRYLRTLQIPGVLNNPTGKPSTGAGLLRLTLGV